ncbi:Chemotaxis protein methyltransferase CheR [Frigoriglobus tundricola]|uniref:Chemotaxis protein methyltransferase CheR n=1 Tax=Frigoriglobus tundricola TaxID=2774151 RepID=A0A6M5YWS8_9BACT|nr:Chemotaxis protein methyltransferase CheR [Frigoriglobus tundricola]
MLCIDDNHDVADSAVDLLRAVGFESLACYDGPTALIEAVSFLPGVCLIDLNMPGMDGDEVAIKLREQADGVPLVLVAVTAASNDRDSTRIRDAGFDMHFVKPVDPHQLVLVVDTLWRAWHRWVLKSSSR